MTIARKGTSIGMTFGLLAFAAGCGSSSGGGTTSVAGAGGAAGGGASGASAGTGGAGAATGCSIAASTAATTNTSPTGCAVLARDTTACQAARVAQGLSGVWLAFSCRTTLTVTTSGGAQLVRIESDGRPDHLSNYFPTTDACHEDYTGKIQNPNLIAAQKIAVDVPLVPDTTSKPMMGAIVGVALDGVPIFANFAAPGDDIFQEAMTFDRCGGHPQKDGVYHYHSEPYALSYDDASPIGVLRDGYPIYGRKDLDGSTPTLDAFGGHTSATPDSAGTAIYHYHLNEQTSTSTKTAGQKQWFLTTGHYRGTPAACATCN